MIKTFILCVLVFYYWYFYATFTKHVAPKPGSPSPSPQEYNHQFVSKTPNHFQFIVNGKMAWEHTLPPSHSFHTDKIVQIDACHGTNQTFVPAKGWELYNYLKSNPETNDLLKFKENNRIQQRGDVFYFKCVENHIDSLHICPSGSTFEANNCQPISLCTDKPDGTKISHSDQSRYIECYLGKEIIQKCPKDTFFNHDHCESINDLINYCQFFPNKPFNLDDTTRVECRDGKPFYIKCNEPGTKFFDKDYCEPMHCMGKLNGDKVPLPQRRVGPFNFTPGYMICQNDKVYDTVECLQSWDDMLSKGDNLTFLPMVYDGSKCSIPTFCENVFSDDPDVLVPVHEFTKNVKNWEFSTLYDRAAGYFCEGKTRKRKNLAPGMLISEKRFKPENACVDEKNLPIIQNVKYYYDCIFKTTLSCPDLNFYNGSFCVPEPKNSFKYNNLPMFQFNNLNSESWITPWDYSKDKVPSCSDPESTYISLYNICSHPDCEKYAFLSQIPNYALLLPEKFNKCKFYIAEKRLKKEPVDFEYRFWDQRVVDGFTDEEDCIPGQNIKTGNFVWDKTIFATCNMDQPFVFCPNSKSIIKVTDSYFACEPPQSKTFVLDEPTYTSFATNEIKHIEPLDPSKAPFNIRINKNRPMEDLPPDGVFVHIGERLNLLAEHAVKLEPRYRVTHPPNVAFEGTQVKTSTPNHGFLVKAQNFTNKPLTFPTYETINFVESFNQN